MPFCPPAMPPPSNEEGSTRWAKFLYGKILLYSVIPYFIDFQELERKIDAKGYHRLLLQFPEGMHIYALEIADKIRALGDYEVMISTKPTYGACDIEVYPDVLTIQFGHSEIPNIRYPENIIFIESFANVSFRPVVERFLNNEKCDSVGLVASVQHVNSIEEVREILKERGIGVFVGRGDARIKYPGQILGCNFSAARSVASQVSCFLFLGTGDFHALGIEMVTGKKTYVLDPYAKRYYDVTDKVDRFKRKRFGAIVKAEEAERFGIIISSKIGQRRWKLALALKEMLESAGKKAYLFLSDTIYPESMYYHVDIFVNTACPRVTYDDFNRFPKPVITPIELEIALKLKLWENFTFDEIVEVDE